MFVRIQREKELIKTTQAPARVVDVGQDGSVELDVEFDLAPQASLRGKSVRTTLMLRAPGRHGITMALDAGDLDVEELVGRIASIVPDAKAAQKAGELLVLAQRTRALGALDPSVPAALGRRLVHVRTSELRRRAQSMPILRAPRRALAPGSDQPASAQEKREVLLQDLMLRGVDPSSRIKPTSSNARAVAAGFASDPTGVPDLRHDSSTSDGLGAEQVVALVASVDPLRPDHLKERLRIPGDRMMDEGRPVDHVLLRLELLDSTNATIDAVTIGLDLARHVAVFRTPRAAPVAAVARSHGGVVLHARPGDAATKALRILRRGISRVGLPDSAYTLVGEFKVIDAHAGVHVPLPPVKSGVVVYRVVPVGLEGVVGAEFTSVVVMPQMAAPARSTVVTTAPVLGGLSVEISNVPAGVCSLEFLRRDLTRREATYSVVGGHVHVDGSLRLTGRIAVVDRDLRQDHVYEHCVRLTYASGRREVAGSAHTEYSVVQEGRAMTSVTDLQVDRSSGTPDVAFTMETVLTESDFDAVKSVLERQGASPLFLQEVTQERDRLRGLIVHRVTRVDMTNGDREDFGVVSGPRFVDSAARVQAGVRPVEDGKKYRYEVEALVRESETMFEELVKVRTDPITRRQHIVRPAKHLHPITRARGTVVSRATLATRHAQGAFGHGRIGSVATVDVSLDRPAALVADAAASALDPGTVVVSWRVQGDVSTVDHFVVHRVTTAGTQTAGKCHAGFPHGSFQFLDSPGDDAGPASYVIVPVSMDFSEGDSAETGETEATRP